MTTARDIIEACAIYGGSAAMAGKSYAEVADAIRALADTYGDAVLCEPEPDCWIDSHTGELRKSYWTAPSNDSVPLYRAKEPT